MVKAVGDEIEGVLATPCAAAVQANVDSGPAVSGAGDIIGAGL